MIRKCQGPAGEPGYQAEVDGAVSECFIYVEGDSLSLIRAGNQVQRAHDELTGTVSQT